MNRCMLVVVAVVMLISVGCGRAPEGRPEPAKGATPPPPAATPIVATAPANPPGWHGDHDPKHGGLLFMDGNLFHHLEGTYPKSGLFQLYVYDDYTKPIDPKGISGSVRLKTGSDAAAHALSYDETTKTLIAQFEPAPMPPFELELRVNLPDPKTGESRESIFDFPFKAIGGEAAVAGGHSHPAGGHSHVAPHGGQVATVGADHHFELVEANGMLTLWILDAQEKTLSVEGMEATLLVQPTSGAAVTITLPPMGTVHFMGNSPLPRGQAGSVIATVTMGGVKRIARFTLGANK